jgi:hypothetical protein
MNTPNRSTHIRLTSHPDPGASARFPIRWGAADPKARGPGDRLGHEPGRPQRHRRAWRLLFDLPRARDFFAAMNPLARPDLRNTHPTAEIGPHPQWAEPDRIVSLDPWGHRVGEVFSDEIATGTDVRPTIAITRARLNMPEILAAMGAHRLAADGGVLHKSGDISGHQGRGRPGLAPARHRGALRHRRETLRRTLFEQTGGMFPGTRHPPRHAGLPAPDRRHDGLHHRRDRSAHRPQAPDQLPGA